MKTIAFIPPSLWVRDTDPFYHSGFDIQPTPSPETNNTDITVESILASSLQSNLSNRASAQPFIVSNALPTGPCRAEILQKKLQTDLKQHPDTDLYLLTADNQMDDSGLLSEDWGFTSWLPTTQGHRQINQPFAFLIPPGSRDKLGNTLQTSGQTLLSLAQHGHLTVRKSDLPIFGHHGGDQVHPGFFTGETPIAGPIRIAAYMPSYKRLEDLIRQTHCILAQSSPVDLYVAVKGFTKYHIENIIKPIFPDAIREGRLHLGYYPNSNQLTNILDCLRDCDLSRYDLFAKIDDDDFYSPDYFEHVRNFHRTIPAHFSSFHTAAYNHYTLKNGIPDFACFYDYICSRTMVITRQVLDKMFLIESEPHNIGEHCDQVRTRYRGEAFFSFNEDNLIKMIMCEHGAANRSSYLLEKGITRHVMAQSGAPSVMRSNYVDPEFRKENSSLAVKRNEHFIQLYHPAEGWEQTARVFNRKYTLSSGHGGQTQGHTVFLGPDKLIIRRKNRVEQYEPDDSLRYIYNPDTSRELDRAATQPDEQEPWRLLNHILPRYGHMNLHQDRETAIACLLSVCPIFDKILLFYHKGANDDGCLDLVKQFISDGRNGNCEITIEHYPYDVCWINDARFLEGEIPPEQTYGMFRQRGQESLVRNFEHDTPYYHWALIDSDQIYITHLFENSFKRADQRSLQGNPARIMRTGYDSMPQDNRFRICKNNYIQGRFGDHLTVNSLAEFVFSLNPKNAGDHRNIYSRLDGGPVPCETEEKQSWFHFRKGVWRGAPPKVRAEEHELVELNPELQHHFNTYIRPLLVASGSTYANIRF